MLCVFTYGQKYQKYIYISTRSKFLNYQIGIRFVRYHFCSACDMDIHKNHYGLCFSPFYHLSNLKRGAQTSLLVYVGCCNVAFILHGVFLEFSCYGEQRLSLFLVHYYIEHICISLLCLCYVIKNVFTKFYLFVLMMNTLVHVNILGACMQIIIQYTNDYRSSIPPFFFFKTLVVILFV